ncbi:cysteine-rich domain-containing protein [Ditylenchus destructor]|nr:cysteine-rich domain-containing protein [Ditylenchus destructor]
MDVFELKKEKDLYPSDSKIAPVPFQCSKCNFSVECRFGPLDFDKVAYKEDVYYMRDPFEPPDYSKKAKDYSVDDFIVVGYNCFICSQPICIDEDCSVFYNHAYCLNCVQREKHSFPRELLQNIQKRAKKDNT